VPEFAAGRTLRRLTVLVLVALAFLPIANWIPGGHSVPWYGSSSSSWLFGTLIVAGVGAVAAILSQRARWLWRPGLADPLIARWEAAPLGGPLVVAVLALSVYLLVSLRVLGARPLLIDEIIQTVQARIFAAGRLWGAQPVWPEFTSSMHLIDWGGKVYGQFPAGGPAIAAIGTMVGAEWAVGPVAGALSVLMFGLLARRVGPTPGAALGATLLFAFAPFAMFMSGSHMTHVTVLTAFIGTALALSVVMAGDKPRPGAAFLSGIGLGIAATIRPLDAVAFALPAAAWYLVRAFADRRRWLDALASGAGVVLPVAALMWVNYHTTGGVLRFGYDVMWGDSKFYGFGPMPGGDVHTPVRGLELTNIYLLRLQNYLFETPLPSLVPALAALWLVDRTTPIERYLNASALLLILLYTGYWHDGFFLGPRLMYPLLAVLALWTARAFVIARERWGGGKGLGWRGVVWGGAVAGSVAAGMAIPIRARQYHDGLLTMRWDPDRAAREAGVRHALVLVRESWGAELLARMWALGVTRSEAEGLYASLDQCELETSLTWAETGRKSAADLIEHLQPAVAERARLQRSPFSPDPTARYLPGQPYSDLCLARRREDQQGFTLFPPLLLARGDNIYARDLHGRDSLLLQSNPDRPVYLLKPSGPTEGEAPAFYPVIRDSAYAAWAAEARQASSGSARQ
jgi:hypothetical protein